MVSKRGIKIKFSAFFILFLLLLFSSYIRAQEEKKLTRVQFIEDTLQLALTPMLKYFWLWRSSKNKIDFLIPAQTPIVFQDF